MSSSGDTEARGSAAAERPPLTEDKSNSRCAGLKSRAHEVRPAVVRAICLGPPPRLLLLLLPPPLPLYLIMLLSLLLLLLLLLLPHR